MPSQTFQNLSEEKKQRIFGAIYSELLRVPFPEMSINQIIKNAGIPRGSFYQYFENKDDAFDYFVEESSKKMKECIFNKISSFRGDIFELAETIFDELAKTGAEQFRFEIVDHVMPYVDVKKVDPFTNLAEYMDEKQKIDVYSSLGIGNLNIKSEEELIDIIGIIEALFQNAIPRIISGSENTEKVTAAFKRKLAIIRKATVKEAF
ncbi:MAG: TetR family transcriptional regulator [Oscillospiraceae bacterium]|nr:TetR family transcriptional regulator [Oscillospiraceae bacterium]MBR3953661.1 TetR family transcriptional regulator [Oscillospiraceae bacterium]